MGALNQIKNNEDRCWRQLTWNISLVNYRPNSAFRNHGHERKLTEYAMIPLYCSFSNLYREICIGPFTGSCQLSKDADIRFTWELFLHVDGVHIWLGVFESCLIWPSSPPNGHPRKFNSLHHFLVLGPYNNYNCYNSMVSRNGSTTKMIIQTHTA
jgi:hypothetical protein